jgi:DNA helicase-2/ATP-dependent DNA helicase PcrA
VLGSMGIPYADPEETLGLLRDRNTRQLLCILRLIVNREDSLAWWGILNLTHGIGPEAIKEIYELARQKKCSFGKIIVKELENDFRNVSTSRNKISAQIQEINRIIEKIDLLNEGRWGSWIVDQIKNNKLPEIPDEMKTLLVKIDDFRDSIEQKGLGQYINQIEPIIKDITNSKTAGRTRIMTLSRSKGLTVRATIIVGAEDGIIPHPKGDCQEERRLLYVGMTRPREYLYITRARRRTGFTARSGQANIAGVRCPCPFLDGGPVSQQDGAKFLNQLDS